MRDDACDCGRSSACRAAARGRGRSREPIGARTRGPVARGYGADGREGAVDAERARQPLDHD
jgi:hypothetical protein